MRRNYYQIILEVYNAMQEQGTHLFSINELSSYIKASWRTTKNVVNLLWRLGLVQKRIIKKRELWRIKEIKWYQP